MEDLGFWYNFQDLKNCEDGIRILVWFSLAVDCFVVFFPLLFWEFYTHIQYTYSPGCSLLSLSHAYRPLLLNQSPPTVIVFVCASLVQELQRLCSHCNDPCHAQLQHFIAHLHILLLLTIFFASFSIMFPCPWRVS